MGKSKLIVAWMVLSLFGLVSCFITKSNLIEREMVPATVESIEGKNVVFSYDSIVIELYQENLNVLSVYMNQNRPYKLPAYHFQLGSDQYKSQISHNELVMNITIVSLALSIICFLIINKGNFKFEESHNYEEL